MAKIAAAFRPKLSVFAFSFEKSILCSLNILFGINPIKIDKKSHEENVKN
jgi:pyruvate kinase